MKTVYLASKSPRRYTLLKAFGVPVEVLAPTEVTRGYLPDDEVVMPHELPVAYIERIVKSKFEQGLAWRREQGAPDTGVVLAADTVVSLGFQILGKPRDRAEAMRFLRDMSDAWHDVRTAVMVGTSLEDAQYRIQHSRVHFVALSPEWMEAYTQTPEPYDKAGGYGIQGQAGHYIDRIEGSYSGIMGLPLFETRALLEAFGVFGSSKDS